MGEYPIKGIDSANVLRKKPSRRSSIRSWRSSSGSQQAVPYRSPTPNQYGGRGTAGSPPNNNSMASESYAPEQPRGQKRWSRSQLPLDLSALNLGNEGSTNDRTFDIQNGADLLAAPRLMSSTTTTTTTYTSHGPTGPRAASQPQRQGFANSHEGYTNSTQGYANSTQGYANSTPVYTNPNSSSIRPVNPSDVQQAYTSSQPHAQPRAKYQVNGYGDQHRQPEYDGTVLTNRTSIPRKEVGASSATVPSQISAASYPSKRHRRDIGGDKALPAAPATSDDAYGSRRVDPEPQTSSIPDRSRSTTQAQINYDAPAPPTPTKAYESRRTEPAPATSNNSGNSGLAAQAQTRYDAQTIVNRAKTSSKDTEVIEKVAPGKLTWHQTC